MTASRQLPLITPAEPARQAAVGAVGLILFNAQHASPARARRQAAWIAEQENADLVIATEVGAGPGGQALIEALGVSTDTLRYWPANLLHLTTARSWPRAARLSPRSRAGSACLLTAARLQP